MHNHEGRFALALDNLEGLTPLIQQVGSQLQSSALLEQEAVAREGLGQFERALALFRQAEGREDSLFRLDQLEEQNLRIQAEQLERQALQAQMNPHFLFNALASLQNHILAVQSG